MKKLTWILVLLVLIFGHIKVNAAVGIVDGERLFEEYPLAQQASKKIADAQDELKEAINESEKAYTEFEKLKKTEAEKLTKQKELQAKLDAKAKSTKEMVEQLSVKLEDDIVAAIKKVSGEKGIDVVFDKRAVLYGGTDITEQVISVLKQASLANKKDF